MESYSFEDANFLIKYYSEKMIGQILSESLESKIIRLEKELVENNKYQVIVQGSTVKEIFYPYINLLIAAKELRLKLPVDVLKNRDI